MLKELTMHERSVLASLDIGSESTRVVIAEIDDSGELRICGWGMHPTAGILNGVVVNNEEIITIIQASMNTAKRQAIHDVEEVCISYGGHSLQGRNYSGGTPISGRNREVSRKDVDMALETATAVPIPMDREIVRIYKVKFSIDGQTDTQMPLSTIGIRLDAWVHIVTASLNEIAGILNVIEKSGYMISLKIPGIEASANAVLTEKEKEKGTIILNIGYLKTEFQAIRNKSPCITGSIPIGGHLVTSDLADALEITLEEAERIKLQVGSCIPDSIINDTITISAGKNGFEYKTISAKDLIGIIAPRMEELFEWIKKEITDKIDFTHYFQNVVLTGGGARLRGAESLAKIIFNLQVRVAGPKASFMVPDTCRNPEWSTAIGLLTVSSCSSGKKEKKSESGKFQKKKEKLIQWLKGFF